MSCDREVGEGAVPERLRQQIDFILEIDRLKSVLRRTQLADGSRRENSAEHSWHLAMMVLVLSEWSDQDLDIQKVICMVLVHDLVEIDAGDTFCYDVEGNIGKLERERVAAERVFSLLPDDQARDMKVLWEEFESRTTPESRFAAAVDRIQPLLSNLVTGGHSWQKYDVRYDQVIERTKGIADASELLWAYMRSELDAAVEDGRLPS